MGYITVIIWILCTLWAYNIAISRGRSGGWCLLGLFFGLIGVAIVALCVKRENTPTLYHGKF
jgi:hypothetical protein